MLLPIFAVAQLVEGDRFEYTAVFGRLGGLRQALVDMVLRDFNFLVGEKFLA